MSLLILHHWGNLSQLVPVPQYTSLTAMQPLNDKANHSPTTAWQLVRCLPTEVAALDLSPRGGRLVSLLHHFFQHCYRRSSSVGWFQANWIQNITDSWLKTNVLDFFFLIQKTLWRNFLPIYLDSLTQFLLSQFLLHQVAGYAVDYQSSVSFATVRNAGHMVGLNGCAECVAGFTVATFDDQISIEANKGNAAVLLLASLGAVCACGCDLLDQAK